MTTSDTVHLPFIFEVYGQEEVFALLTGYSELLGRPPEKQEAQRFLNDIGRALVIAAVAQRVVQGEAKLALLGGEVFYQPARAHSSDDILSWVRTYTPPPVSAAWQRLLLGLEVEPVDLDVWGELFS
jgi:hypothetical protein